jgi:hypothetical protein
MKLLLPHSAVKSDLPDAQELMDNFLALKRFLEDYEFAAPDMASPFYRFYVPFNFARNNVAAGNLNGTWYIPVPVACLVTTIEVASSWSGAGGHLVFSVLKCATVGGADTVVGTTILTNLWPAETITCNVSVGKNEWLKIQVGGPYINSLSVSCVIECKAAVEVG